MLRPTEKPFTFIALTMKKRHSFYLWLKILTQSCVENCQIVNFIYHSPQLRTTVHARRRTVMRFIHGFREFSGDCFCSNRVLQEQDLEVRKDQRSGMLLPVDISLNVLGDQLMERACYWRR